MKVKDIKNIDKKLKEYKKLQRKETDYVKSLRYKRKIEELEYDWMDVKTKILDIELYLHDSTYKKMFVDKYIYNLTYDQLAEKYGINKGTISTKLKKAREVYESDDPFSIYMSD